jgi:hypothetical protein
MVDKLPDVAYLRTTEAIRERCRMVFELGRSNQLRHFSIDLGKLPEVVAFVTKIIRDNYPDLNVPYHSRWRHFEVDGIQRAKKFLDSLASPTPREVGRISYELAITSVLLDAGAGPKWSYLETESNRSYCRSEGLAVASFDTYRHGGFSSSANCPYVADPQGLGDFTVERFAKHFKISPANPMTGGEGRCQLIQTLGKVVGKNSQVFSQAGQLRLGHFFDHVLKHARNNCISALDVLAEVLATFQDIWPGRVKVAGVNLGDVWTHSQIVGESPQDHLVPFHKLSQWLTYSLLEPLEEFGLRVIDIEKMTGLPEYRNGGLFIDMGLLICKNPELPKIVWKAGDEAIVEWRALTVHLLDIIAIEIAAKLKLTPQEFPLAKVLQGGTWAAGRAIAKERRVGGVPPLTIDSDGTVF